MQLHQAGWVFNDLREAMADRVFEKIYGTKELHCSKDGFTLQRPTERELGQSPNDHYDQGFSSRGLQCIQGSVALTDQEHDDGCFLCWPGSHRLHDEIVDWRGPKKGREDFVILDHREREWLQAQGYKPKRVHVNRGDVILWRSDLVHKGAPPIGIRDNFRAVVYVCMLPAALTPEDVYTEKRLAYQQLQTGSHWPNREEWFQSKSDRGLVRPFFKNPPQLSLRQQQLYGLVRYTSSSTETALTSSWHPEKTQADGITSKKVEEHGDVKLPGNRRRRWARSTASEGTTAEQGESERAEASSAPQAISTSSSNVDATPSVDTDGQLTGEARRLKKALREIESLETKQSGGEKLRRNQVEKISKKEQYLHELQCLAPTLGA